MQEPSSSVANELKSDIKLEINQITGSKIREVKEYTAYWYPNLFSKYLVLNFLFDILFWEITFKKLVDIF